ncbi:YrdB family protein [Streptomyces sp. NBC_00083]|uniref:YrdB family protein n=1 Tax=Streptomyces sp. NBC_00083 TaxID=2975647 RepID=UPI002258CB45|nr:YrdB family protein [Streptomyces sp. NBC_00083]MCX5384808.1 YrdB family protein [Streptomyces sp. NBC_00083]
MQLPRPAHLINEGLAFVLELCALTAIGVWGYAQGGPVAVRILLALAAPGLAAVVWGMFAAPKARVHLPQSGVLLVKAVVFGSATAALFAVGHHAMAVSFAVVVLVNTALATLDRRTRRQADRLSPTGRA